MKPKLIIFDFSGTLAYFKKSDPLKFFGALKESGINIKEKEEIEEFNKFFGQLMALSKNWRDFSEQLLRKYNLNHREEDVKKLADFLKEEVAPKPYEDLNEITDLPFSKAILSTGSEFLIKQVDLLKRFEIFAPERTKFVKPDPRAFTFVLEEMRVRAEETLMIGDEYERDLLPAKNLGIEAVLIDRNNEINNPPVKKINSLKKLKDILGL